VRRPLKMCTRCGTILSRVQPKCWGCYLKDNAREETPNNRRMQPTEHWAPVSYEQRIKRIGDG